MRPKACAQGATITANTAAARASDFPTIPTDQLQSFDVRTPNDSFRRKQPSTLFEGERLVRLGT